LISCAFSRVIPGLGPGILAFVSIEEGNAWTPEPRIEAYATRQSEERESATRARGKAD
jgi:hypothetical protein